MDLQQYLKKEFNDINLFEDSFIGKDFVIHLQLEKNLYQLKDNSTEINIEYFNNVYNKATEIFEEIFKEGDEIYLVSHIRSELNLSKNRRTNIFKLYLKNQKDKYNLKYKQVILNDDEEKIIQYSVLLSNKNKLNYKSLIKAICNQDFRELKPRFNDKYTYYPEIFFVNKNKNIILNIFDDRGCFILFKDLNDLNFFKKNIKMHL